MNRFNNVLLGFLGVAFGTVMSVSTAQAVPINGEISFGGSIDPTLVLATTNVLNFNNPSIVLNATGDFATNGITTGVAATFNNFQFNPLVTNNPLWSIPGFQFALSTTTIITQAPGDLVLNGTGTLTSSFAGLDATPFLWSLSADRTGPALIAFSSTNAPNNPAAPIPEPGTMLLMGSGLLGLGLWRKLKK